jgi:hypothetical protein
MKKMDYLAPEMEIIELKNTVAILAGSNGEQTPGTGDSEEL